MEKELEDSEDLILTRLGVTRCDEVDESESRSMKRSFVHLSSVPYKCLNVNVMLHTFLFIYFFRASIFLNILKIIIGRVSAHSALSASDVT